MSLLDFLLHLGLVHIVIVNLELQAFLSLLMKQVDEFDLRLVED